MSQSDEERNRDIIALSKYTLIVGMALSWGDTDYIAKSIDEYVTILLALRARYVPATEEKN